MNYKLNTVDKNIEFANLKIKKKNFITKEMQFESHAQQRNKKRLEQNLNLKCVFVFVMWPS